MNFRLLKANEIECRIAAVKKGSGVALLLYKDARVDQNILDETVGSMNWQRHHSRDNANCTVSIWDDAKKQWIEKEDTGKESYTEKEKGLASDSFKRACFNWGIGRELYSAPFIWVTDCTITDDNKCYDTFYVDEIDYDENRNISHLVIRNKKTKKVVFKTGGEDPAEPAEKEPAEKKTELKATKKQIELLHKLVPDEDWQKMLDWVGIEKVEDMTAQKASEIITAKTKKEA